MDHGPHGRILRHLGRKLIIPRRTLFFRLGLTLCTWVVCASCFTLPIMGTQIRLIFTSEDRWLSSNLMASTYIWLPLTVSGTTASLPTNYINWILDPSTGAGTAGPSETTNEGEAATFSGGAKVVDCPSCSGTSAAGWIGGSSGGTVTFSNVHSSSSTTTTIRVKNQVRYPMVHCECCVCYSRY